MKYLKSCLPKERLLYTNTLLISVSFIEIGFYFDKIYLLQFQCNQFL